VHWYNVQFYCGWGDAGDERLYEAIVASGWNPRKLVLGVITNPENGSGHVDLSRLARCIGKLMQKYGSNFGGVMGWEYFNAGGNGKPEEWVKSIARMLGRTISVNPDGVASAATTSAGARPGADAPVPTPSDTADIQAAMQDATLLGEQAESAPRRSQSSAPAASESTEAPSTSVPPNDAKVRRLVEMGFERAEAIAALEAMGGDVDAAAGILFGD
jgi:cyclin-dependent kinase